MPFPHGYGLAAVASDPQDRAVPFAPIGQRHQPHCRHPIVEAHMAQAQPLAFLLEHANALDGHWV